MFYRGKHAKPLVDWKAAGSYLAMLGLEAVFVFVLIVAWLNSPL